MEKEVCANVIITGRVQGVFFRAETQRAAVQLNLRGWVRNLPDGAVEAEFEGPRERVDQMLEWCWRGSPHSRVADVKVIWKDCAGTEGFSVRY
ncbi:MAG: acylphosphatase [Desulfosarcinaceae bacterium]